MWFQLPREAIIYCESKCICYRQFKSTKDGKSKNLMNHTFNKRNDTNCSDSAKRFCWHHYIMWSNGVVVSTSDFEFICLNRRFYAGIFWKGEALSKFSPMVAFVYILAELSPLIIWKKKWRSDQSRDCDFSLSNWFTYMILFV